MPSSPARHGATGPARDSQSATDASSSVKQFHRTYQACLHCRKRKVKCVPEDDRIGSDPTCVKCRRERRVCVFTRERRIHPVQQPLAPGQETGRTVQTVHDTSDHSFPAHVVSRNPPNNHNYTQSPESRTHVSGPEAASRDGPNEEGWQAGLIEGVIQSSITNQKDALNLLYRAVEYQDSNQATGRSSPDQIPASDPPDWNVSLEHDNTIPAAPTEQWCIRRHQLSRPPPEVVDAWKACPFVMQRWMTPLEAVTWVDLFFQHMAIFSPVVDDFYRPHRNHHILINKEPILCSTILMLSCRYHHLTGNGSLSRGFLLHERLWKYCQSLFNQVWWGEERRSWPRIRTVGAIQSLLLLAEWHPRAFHLTFDFCMWNSNSEDPIQIGQAPNSWHEGVLEPVRKSNRMSWMLLGSAVALSHEIGLFSEKPAHSTPSAPSAATETSERLKRLLFIFINNVTSRLGCQVPKMPLFHTSILSVLENPSWTEKVEWSDWMISWMDLTRIVRSSSEILFPSEVVTKELLQNGRYGDLLEHFGHVLDRWLEKYPRITGPDVRYDILFIEYQYIRIYINSLAMQATVMRRKNRLNSVLFDQSDIYPQDSTFIHQIFAGCQTVLEMVLKHSQLGYLKYLPVRVHIQIASTAVYLIKALALGIQPEDLSSKSLDLLEQTAQKLRTDTVDDIYLAVQFASLLETHVQVLRRRFARNLEINTESHGFSSIFANAGEIPEEDVAYYDQFIFGDDWLAPQCDAPFLNFFDGDLGQNSFNLYPDGLQTMIRPGPLP